jgi:hypothetical protein
MHDIVKPEYRLVRPLQPPPFAAITVVMESNAPL